MTGSARTSSTGQPRKARPQRYAASPRLRPPTTARHAQRAGLLQLKNRGLRDASLWLGDGGFALRHGDILDLAVHPESRRHGVGTALAAEAAARRAQGRGVVARRPPGRGGRIARSSGIPRERELVIMRRSLVDLLEPVTVPDGVRIRGFEPGDEQALLEVNASAFAHHPEQGHMTHEDFRERTSEPWFDPAGLLLAVPADPRTPASPRCSASTGPRCTATRTRPTARSTSSR